MVSEDLQSPLVEKEEVPPEVKRLTPGETTVLEGE